MSQVRFEKDAVVKALQVVRDIAETDVVQVRLKQDMERAVDEVLKAAVNKTPHSERILRDSAQSHVEMRGVALMGSVTYGGQAASYASVQHESLHFRHTLPPGVSRTHTATGRRRKTPIKGYKGGQAKFLHGRGSAWDERGPSVMKLLEDKFAQHAKQVIEEQT